MVAMVTYLKPYWIRIQIRGMFIPTQFELWLKTESNYISLSFARDVCGGIKIFIDGVNTGLFHTERSYSKKRNSSNTLCTSLLPTDHIFQVKNTEKQRKESVRKMNQPPLLYYCFPLQYFCSAVSCLRNTVPKHSITKWSQNENFSSISIV